MLRRVRLIVFFGVITMLILATGISAGAQSGDIQSKEAEIAAAQQRLMEFRAEESAALPEYNSALHKMNELNVKIAEADKDLDAAEDRLAAAQEDLEKRASEMYKSGNVAFINVLVGSDDFSQFATRLDLWVRLLGEEKAEVEAVREAKDDLEARKSALETERANRVEAVEEALVHKENAAAAEAEAEAYLNSLNAELRNALQAEQARQAELARAAAEKAVRQAPAPEPVVAAVEAPQIDLEALEAALEEAQRRAALMEAAAAERAADRAADKAAAREAERAAKQAAIERRAERRAEKAAAELEAEEMKAAAAASASASAAPAASASPSASAPAARGSGGGGSPSCGDDFGGVKPHVAEAGCDLQDRFGLRVTGIGYSDYHWDGLDLDIWTTDVTLGNQVRDYAVANYAVEYTCWQDRYINYVTGWEESCPGHMDHVHVTFSP